MISTHISRASAALLALGGLALLFAADAILPRLIPGFPVEGAWLGQLMGAGWLAVAALNWLSQRQLIGGIYGRSIVMANVTLYLLTALALSKVILRDHSPAALWALFVPAVIFAGIYSWLMLRGPVESDLQSQASSPKPR